jgi:hypothetical protein
VSPTHKPKDKLMGHHTWKKMHFKENGFSSIMTATKRAMDFTPSGFFMLNVSKNIQSDQKFKKQYL